MKVSICSREEVEKQSVNDFPENLAVISFYNPEGHDGGKESSRPVDYKGKTDRVFYISTYDIDLSVLQKFGLTYETYLPEADRLASFIYDAKEEGYDILCQCEYGESRSAGCAAAILEHFYKNGITIFSDYRYYPNQLVYHKVYDALERYKQERKSI